MSANVNKVILVGRLTRDPELRYTPNRTAVCDLSLVVSRRFSSRDGERREEATFVDIVVWQRQAENCKQYLQKGRTVYVEGRLTQDRWESKTGEKRTKLRVTAEVVQFLDRPPGAPEAPAQSEAGPEDEAAPAEADAPAAGAAETDDDTPF